MLVRYFMTSPVTTLTADMPCRDALNLFREEGFRRAPVVLEGRLVGMISDRDLLRVLPYSAAEASTEPGLRAEHTLVGAVMTRNPVTTTPESHLEDVAAVMLQRKIGGVPVLDRGAVVGILTETDLFRALVAIGGYPGSARMTVSLPSAKKEPEDVALIALRLGLRMVTRLTHASRGGAPLVTLRVVGEHWADLPEALAAAGYGVIEIVPPTAKAA